MIRRPWKMSLGVLLANTPRPLYWARKEAPPYMQRAVELANTYCGDHIGSDNTDEDMAVRWAKRVFWWLEICCCVLALIPLWNATLDIAIYSLALPATVLVNVIAHAIFGESLTDLLASRLLGVPAQPLVYIDYGIQRGLIGIIDDD